MLAEADEDNDLLREYVYGNYLDEVLLVRDVTASEDYYYAHDHLYSPVALLDEAGTVLERYEFDAYGRRHVFDGDFEPQSASSYGLPIAFTGQRLDVLDGGDLEVMYYKNRYYDPETGRFLAQDPIGYVDGMNLYEYVKSRPSIGKDPLGLEFYDNDFDICCKVKEDPVHRYPVSQMHPGIITYPTLGKACIQINIGRNYKGWDPLRACKCHFKNKPSVKVYGAYQGRCCWCDLYLVHCISKQNMYFLGIDVGPSEDLVGKPVLEELNHGYLEVVCNNNVYFNHNYWEVEMMPGNGYSGTLSISPGSGKSPSLSNPSGYRREKIGRINCSTALSVLGTSKTSFKDLFYFELGWNCHNYARYKASYMLAFETCP